MYTDVLLPIIKNYNQWKKDNQDLFEELEPQYEKCERCKGEGLIECDCCGHDRDCPDCNGNGYMGEIPQDIYTTALKKDLQLFAAANPGWECPGNLIWQLEKSTIDLIAFARKGYQ